MDGDLTFNMTTKEKTMMGLLKSLLKSKNDATYEFLRVRIAEIEQNDEGFKNQVIKSITKAKVTGRINESQEEELRTEAEDTQPGMESPKSDAYKNLESEVGKIKLRDETFRDHLIDKITNSAAEVLISDMDEDQFILETMAIEPRLLKQCESPDEDKPEKVVHSKPELTADRQSRLERRRTQVSGRKTRITQPRGKIPH